jgi:hypothetical protein
MKFILEIELGNPRQTSYDIVAKALEVTAEVIAISKTDPDTAQWVDVGDSGAVEASDGTPIVRWAVR